MIAFLRKKPYLLMLAFILLVSLFFRTYKVIDRFEFAHDGDLYSWFVKDVVVDRHLRLIGQMTTAPGIFIGPVYYYLNIPFFFLSNMYPTGAIIPITIIGILTVLSYYLVFSKLFNTKVGLIAAFLYAVLLSVVELDRRVVPSTPSNIWTVWFFYTIINIARGNYRVLPFLGILIGLIWHIHIALIPALIAVPVAFLASKKLPTRKQFFLFLIALSITSLPLIIFEVRHHFQQTISFFQNFTVKNDGASGLYKFRLVLEMVTTNINSLFFMPQSFPFFQNPLFVILILLSAVISLKKKLLAIKDLIPLYSWVFGVIAFYSLSSSPISGYYFANIEIIFLAFTSLVFYLIYRWSKLGKLLILCLFSIILVKNAYFLVSQSYYHKGYMEKKKIVDYIVQDANKNNFPCVGITYITSPGENVGFRYLFYLSNLRLVHPSLQVPVYNIVIPDELSLREVKIKFGHIGLIPPNNFSSSQLGKACQGENTNLTDSMFGFVK